MIVLSKRLQSLANFVRSGATVADIGSDHALLPVYLVQAGQCPSGIAADINKGPYEAAGRQVRAAGLADVIQVRHGAGLLVLAPEEAEVVTIAGMGGSLMADILEEGRIAGRLAGVKELVLQPNVAADVVRLWLLNQGWLLVDEALVEEDGKFYEVLHAVRDPQPHQVNNPYEQTLPDALILDESDKRRVLLQLGPYLLNKGGDVFKQKWLLELASKQRVVDQLALSQSPESAQRRTIFERELQHLRQVLEASDKQTLGG